jgi:hypothetical protein
VADSFQDQLVDLVAVFGSNRRAAEFIGLTHSRVPAWIAGEVPSANSLERIVDGASVIKQLRTHGLGNRAIVTELHSMWPELGARPVELVQAGEVPAVLDAITARYGVPTPFASPADLAAALQALAQAASASAVALAQGAQ